MEEKLKIEGLSQVSRGLKRVNSEAPKQLRVALNSAADLLIHETRPKIPAVTGRARRSLVAKSTRTSARVSVGGKRAPWYPWLDFGGQGRIQGRPPERPFIKSGRYFYPTLTDIRPKIQEQLQDSINTVLRDAGLVAT